MSELKCSRDDWTVVVYTHLVIPSRRKVLKIVSGGQTGADRAGLDFAIAHQIRHGGWCPKGRWAEDGKLPKRYRLKETGSSYPAVRTRWNVRDSDGTVIFALRKRLGGGTKLTETLARKYGKPVLRIVAPGRNGARALEAFVRRYNVRVLNVAGPRESGQRGVYEFTSRVLERWWRLVSEGGRPRSKHARVVDGG